MRRMDQREYKVQRQLAGLCKKHSFDWSPAVVDAVNADKNLMHASFTDFFHGNRQRESTVFLVRELEKALAAADHGNGFSLMEFGLNFGYMIDNLETARKLLKGKACSKECKILIFKILHANLIGTVSGELIVPSDHHTYGWFGAGEGGDRDCFASKRDFMDVLEKGCIVDDGLGGNQRQCDAVIFAGFESLDPNLQLFRQWVGKQSTEELEDTCFRMVGCALWNPKLFERMAAIIEEKENGIFARLKDSNGNGALWHAMPTFDAAGPECECMGEEFWDVYEKAESRTDHVLAVEDVLLKLECDPYSCGDYNLSYADIAGIAAFWTSYYYIEPYGRNRLDESVKAENLITLVEYYKWRKDRVARGFCFSKGGKPAKSPTATVGEKLLTP